eukprot:CAMPEP_0183792922 /NCGR_PEP_ID=MMETSP0803_2-20130417/2881_1 /TAXON_ID=195967 /ORGANISM="Crustomastix stigmata, Strain CCMP3273" /LENGTH=506 /DNA_ID=CAMNT_0026037291 /DNA_START=162 /DNA_END=1682 /DNA_ORIENTATION=+
MGEDARRAVSVGAERLDLERRNLTECFSFPQENRIRLLNYQHNMIRKISHMHNLHNLVFLDLYSNEIDCLRGLGAIPSLRVLMLGRNRISNIEGLENLKKLDVLDLHNNLISDLTGLCSLHSVRILNLAGNVVCQLPKLLSLTSLTELNLRRNQLSIVFHTATDVHLHCGHIDNENGTSKCNTAHTVFPPNLQRLYLSYNRLCSVTNITTLSHLHSLKELALDGNPLAYPLNTGVSCNRQYILELCSHLHVLDSNIVSAEERRQAYATAQRRSVLNNRMHEQSYEAEPKAQMTHSECEINDLVGDNVLNLNSTLEGKNRNLDSKLPKRSNKVCSTERSRIYVSVNSTTSLPKIVSILHCLTSLHRVCLRHVDIRCLSQLESLALLASLDTLDMIGQQVTPKLTLMPVYCAHRMASLNVFKDILVGGRVHVKAARMFEPICSLLCGLQTEAKKTKQHASSAAVKQDGMWVASNLMQTESLKARSAHEQIMGNDSRTSEVLLQLALKL